MKMVDELIVKSVTSNRLNVDAGQFARFIIVYGTKEGLVEAYEGELIVELNGNTVHTEMVATGGDDEEIELPIRIDEEGKNEVCAFIQNVQVVGPSF